MKATPKSTGTAAPGAPSLKRQPPSPAVVVERHADASLLRADEKLIQLRTLLWCSYGVGVDWFEEIGQDNRDTLLWLCSDLAEEINDLVTGKTAAGDPA
jgi:hypothetical protein